jgi:hypothetical protein
MKMVLLAMIHAIAVMACAAGEERAREYKVPSNEEIAAARQRFLNLSRPLSYRHVIDKYGGLMGGGMSHMELRGDALALADETSKVVLIYALWPLLDGEEHDAEAFVFLSALLGHKITHSFSMNPLIKDPRTLLDVERLGEHWPRLKSGRVHSLKGACGRYLGKSGDWYPHEVLFDQEIVLKGRSDAALRAKLIAEMREALRDPALASKNPLETGDIFGYLGMLKAKEAAPEAIAYLFFSWKQGGDFRLDTRRLNVRPDEVEDGLFQWWNLNFDCYIPLFLAENVGDLAIPMVLDRYARTSATERAVQDGGGCAPVFILRYFRALGYSRPQTVAAIERYFRERQEDLTKDQSGVINTLLDLVRGGKYQGDRRYFNDANGWSPVGP